MAGNALPQGYRGKEFCPRTAPRVQVFHTYLTRDCMAEGPTIVGPESHFPNQ